MGRLQHARLTKIARLPTAAPTRAARVSDGSGPPSPRKCAGTRQNARRDVVTRAAVAVPERSIWRGDTSRLVAAKSSTNLIGCSCGPIFCRISPVDPRCPAKEAGCSCESRHRATGFVSRSDPEVRVPMRPEQLKGVPALENREIPTAEILEHECPSRLRPEDSDAYVQQHQDCCKDQRRHRFRMPTGVEPMLVSRMHIAGVMPGVAVEEAGPQVELAGARRRERLDALWRDERRGRLELVATRDSMFPTQTPRSRRHPHRVASRTSALARSPCRWPRPQ